MTEATRKHIEKLQKELEKEKKEKEKREKEKEEKLRKEAEKIKKEKEKKEKKEKAEAELELKYQAALKGLEERKKKKAEDKMIGKVIMEIHPYRNDKWRIKPEILNYWNMTERDYWAKFMKNLQDILKFIMDYPSHPLSTDDFFCDDINFLYNKFDDLTYKHLISGYRDAIDAQSSINSYLDRFTKGGIYYNIAQDEANSHRGLPKYEKIQELIEDLHWNAINFITPIYKMLTHHK